MTKSDYLSNRLFMRLLNDISTVWRDGNLFLDSVLYSYAQIFFSNRKWFGLAALLISFIDVQVGALGFLGVLLSNSFALYLNFDKDKIRKGFYGFNGILLGAAIGFFFEITPLILGMAIVFIFLAFFISASMEHLMANVFNLPGLSLPFILTLYVFLIVVTNFNGVLYRDLLTASTGAISFLPDCVNLLLNSVALILLQSKAVAGFLILIIILVFSRVMFINSLIAFFFNFAVISILFKNPSYTLLILTSFNAILIAFALGGSMIILSKKTIPLLLMTIFFTIIFTLFFESILAEKLLPVLVLPFNFVALSTIYSLKFRKESTDLTLLYFSPGSPEENYYYHTTRTARFEGFKYMFPEFPFLGEWKITQAFDGKHTHKEEWKYAWDFEIADETGKFYSNDGAKPSDFYCFNTPVVAPLDGEVVRVIDSVHDNNIDEVNLEQNWGNTLIIDHGNGLFSSMSHLKRKSILPKVGDKVKKGQVVARCGNSGRSPKPHLHFQFQLTDKLGDKTYKFPFSQYILKTDSREELKVFEYPEENQSVKNIDVHKIIKNAFTFKLGDEFTFNCSLDGKKFTERWKVNVDILNTLYIENRNGDRLNIFISEKIFYASNYIGKQESALYFFYLSASKAPLGYSEKLFWEDVFPLGTVTKGFTRYISEFFLFYGEVIKSKGVYNWFSHENETISLRSKLKIFGTGIFSFYKRDGEGEIIISPDSGLQKITYRKNEKNFTAQVKGD